MIPRHAAAGLLALVLGGFGISATLVDAACETRAGWESEANLVRRMDLVDLALTTGSESARHPGQHIGRQRAADPPLLVAPVEP